MHTHTYTPTHTPYVYTYIHMYVHMHTYLYKEFVSLYKTLKAFVLELYLNN